MPTSLCRKWLPIALGVSGMTTIFVLVYIEMNSQRDDLSSSKHADYATDNKHNYRWNHHKRRHPNCDYQEQSGISEDQHVGSKNVWHVTGRKETMPKCPLNAMLIILVTSSPEHSHRRNVIRQTWGRPQFYGNYWTTTYFLLGKTSSPRKNSLVQIEARKSKDVLIGDYLDSYRNLTLKVLNGFSWVMQFCLPRYVLKTDDDCFVNTPLILEHLVKDPIEDQKGLYVGRVNWDSPVIRDEKNSWFVSSVDYPGLMYPPYASGIGYIVSEDVISKMLVEAEFVKPFPNEDAYIGVLARNVGIEPISSSRFSPYSHSWQLCNFLYLMVIHNVAPPKQKEMMNSVYMAKAQCFHEDLGGWH